MDFRLPVDIICIDVRKLCIGSESRINGRPQKLELPAVVYNNVRALLEAAMTKRSRYFCTQIIFTDMSMRLKTLRFVMVVARKSRLSGEPYKGRVQK